MRRSNLILVGAVTGAIYLAGFTLLGLAQGAKEPPKGPPQISYSEDIQPIFNGWCTSCHAPGGQGFEASGLDLTSYAGLMKGTKFGPMVIPKQPDVSNLMVMLQGEAQIRMPLGHKPLPNALRLEIWGWIFQGAKDN